MIRFKTNRELLRDSMIPNHMMSMFDSLLNESAGKFERNVFFTPRTDVVENEKSFQLMVSLPGMKKEDIQIGIEGDVLTISGERKLNSDTKSEKIHMVESYYGKFSRSFNLPEHVDKQKIDASFTDGILHLSLPKTEVKDLKTTVTIK